MSVEIGTRLGSYEITALLGKGGMGEVYRARDTKLKREVAIKILPDEFSGDADRLTRFQREAEVLASLNHPNIATIYDLQESNEKRFLVLELVNGETLADRIQRGPIPIGEALEIGKNICEALEAAHEKGIIHRDLKPPNVKITPDGKVKVLDFGLARALENSPILMASNSPTLLSAIATNAGVILGTAGYMSPEQARGRGADHRSDIFSFGCVLYEMITGRTTFDGETVTEVIASVLKQDADLSLVPANVHPRVLDLIRRCLVKDPKKRWHAAADVRVEIETILAESSGLKTADLAAAPMPRWQFAAAISITAIVAALGSAGMVWRLGRTPPTSIARFSFVLPAGQSTTRGGRRVIAVSPDGENIVYQANQQLYLRSMAEVDARPIEGTNSDAADPFFSADGKWIGFYSVAERRLKKIAVTGGAAVTMAEVDFPLAASWTADDQILLADPRKGILRVSANGGKSETLISAKADQVMNSPQLLPDRDHLLFTVRSATGVPNFGPGRASASDWDKAQIVVQSLRSGERKTLIEGGADGRYVPTGHLVYALGSTLLAVPFDAAKLEKVGGPVPVTEGVARAGFNASGVAQLSFAANGTMVYFVGNTSPYLDTKVALVDRNGKAKPLPLPAERYYYEPRVSPDGKQAAVMSIDDQGSLLSVYELSQAAALRRLTFQAAADHPLWTPDGQRIIFDSGGTLFWQRADGNGAAEELAKPQESRSFVPDSVSPDGKTLLFFAGVPNRGDIWSLSLNGDHKPKPLISGDTNQTHAYFSPDGRWIVYVSAESSQPQIYVQPFPPTGAKYQITTTGGISPIWSPDGKQIFYIASSGDTRQLSSVDVHTQPSFGFANSTKLPIDKIAPRGGVVRPYDITPDGKQFLIVYRDSNAPEQPAQTQIRITLNWFEELKRRVPVK
jgi:serine/threonine protein kinase/Tol biopolymer transport system component